MSAGKVVQAAWLGALGRNLGSMQLQSLARGNFADPAGRNELVAKIRWFLAVMIGCYGVFAAGFYAFSEYGLFLTREQVIFLLVSVGAFLGCNTLYHFHYERIRNIRYAAHLQVLIDFLLITLLIHFSGGGASWFWPVYLVATLEAAILLDRKREVWLLGGIGGLMFGAMLAGQYLGWFCEVPMPFVDPQLHHDGLFLLLIWLWVSLLNAAIAVIGSFLMSVIRNENEALRRSERRLVNFLDSANDLIFSATPEGRLLYANHSWKSALGFDPDTADNLNLLDIIHPTYKSKCQAAFGKAAAGQRVNVLEGSFIACDRRPIDVEGNITCNPEDGDATVIWGICRDVTERKKAQEQLYHLAHHDMLTGLPNRLFFIDRLKHARAMARRGEKQVAVLFLDLDRFKIINDTLGHSVGDQLLQEAASRLLECVREVDTVARLGGDEFTVALCNVNGVEDVEQVAQKILKALSRPMALGGHELFITTSIGICLYPDHGEEPVELIKNADIAMYNAKTNGRNNYQFYDQAMDQEADKRLMLETGMRKALEREEFRIYYQPKVDMVSGRVTAMEALLRWEHPELGMLPPSSFISLAEETGLIFPIGEWVLRHACLQNRAWQDQGLAPVRVAVNLSGYQLQHKGLIATVRKILEETGLDPMYLELEVTETVVMQNPDFAVAILNELRGLGIHISIDDFGTGYSSLAHLKRFSVNTLKIDKSFVREVDINSTDAAIATAIIAMGNSLNLKVIAEGVENEGQFSFLRENKCDEMQGYLFSKPVPPQEAAKLLRGEGLKIPETALAELSI
ncbi:GGDEF domain-containing protein [Desulfuromonas versatilis]|uniref:GGDEF domain-containing protein n=1 Tax=Desulfuromonas versatilis TaxID=2802975 RepID=A0ABM8HPU9_9BACT|nr:EAL domain-containing protein [Desulfuromonas versatilis]BCR03724.1 GGDEF domain-containing protein [Desulfuromonas versatilis]